MSNKKTREKKKNNNKYTILESIAFVIDIILLIINLILKNELIQPFALFIISIFILIILYNVLYKWVEERTKKEDIFTIGYKEKLEGYERYKKGNNSEIRTFSKWKEDIKKEIKVELRDKEQYEEFQRWIDLIKNNASTSIQITFNLFIPVLIANFSVMVPVINEMSIFKESRENKLLGEETDLILLGIIIAYIFVAGIIIIVSARNMVNNYELVKSFAEDLLVVVDEIKVSESEIREERSVAITSSYDPNKKFVYISQNGGKKYHKIQSCCSMKSSKMVTLEQAQKDRFTECKRCNQLQG